MAANILPVFMIFFMSKKKWLMVMFVLLIVIMNFSINGSKSTLLKLFLCFLLYFVSKDYLKDKILPLMVVLMVIALLEYKTIGTDIIGNMIVRRAFYIPTYLDTLFYNVIHESGPIFYSHKIYGQEITFYVGDVFFGKDEMRANNGLFSDAYMNLGVVGIILYPLFYSFFVHICEVLFNGHDDSIKFFVVFLIIFALRSSEITTAFLTHGIFLLCVVMAVIPTFGNKLSTSSSPTINKVY